MAYTGTSIVDYLKSVGQDSSYSNRTKLATQHGIQNYQGTAQQNTQLLRILNKPVTTSTSATTPTRTTTTPSSVVTPSPTNNPLVNNNPDIPDISDTGSYRIWAPNGGLIATYNGKLGDAQAFASARGGVISDNAPTSSAPQPVRQNFTYYVPDGRQVNTGLMTRIEFDNYLKATGYTENNQQSANQQRTPITLGNSQTVYVDNQGNFTDESGNAVSNQTVAGSTAESVVQDDGENNGDGTVYDTGNQQLDDILTALSDGLTKIIDSGKVINPDIELTPAQISQFTEMASSQISPYYRSQIESIRKDLDLSVQNLQKQYEVSKQGAEESFKQSLGGQRESMSGLGTTFSGQRGQQEQSMVSAQNRALDLSALQTENQIGSNLRSLEGQIGSSNLPSVPGFQTYRATAEGRGGFTPGRTLNFGGIGGVTGSLQQDQKEAELLRLSKFKKAARENRSLDYYL